MTVRIDEQLRASLETIAVALDRDKSYVVNEALKGDVELHEWQLKEIEEGLRQADAGAFVPEAEVEALLNKLRGR